MKEFHTLPLSVELQWIHTYRTNQNDILDLGRTVLLKSSDITNFLLLFNNNALFFQMIRPIELASYLRRVFRCERRSLASKYTSEAWGWFDRAPHFGQHSIVILIWVDPNLQNWYINLTEVFRTRWIRVSKELNSSSLMAFP